MKFNRLFGGTAAAALARTAASLAADETSGRRADDDPETGPEDEEDEEEEQRPAAETETPGSEASAAPATPPAAPAAAEPEAPELTAEQRLVFEAGAAARDLAYAEVFNATVEGSDELIVSGREAAAVLLMSEGLSAEKTIKMLGKLPKDASGDAMLHALKTEASRTPSAGAGGGSEPDAAKAAWGKACTRLGFNKPNKDK
jgi:hypothetical protein